MGFNSGPSLGFERYVNSKDNQTPPYRGYGSNTFERYVNSKDNQTHVDDLVIMDEFERYVNSKDNQTVLQVFRIYRSLRDM